MIGRALRFVVRRGFRLCLFASALCLGGVLATHAFSETVSGSGTRATEDRHVGAVTEVTLSGTGDLTVIQGDVPALSVTADDNILPLLETEVSGRKLTLRTRSGSSIRPKTRIAYTLTVPSVEKLTVSGVGNVQAEGLKSEGLAIELSGVGNATLRDLVCTTVTVTVSGAGNATLSGTVERATVKLSGAGKIDAAELKARTADVQISGAGNARVWAGEELKARVSGAGGIKYKGNPRLEQKVSGAGSIKPLGE